MKKILRSAWFGFLLLLTLRTVAFASDITVSGSAYFKCDFLSKYMVKHGYFLIKENVTDHSAKTNLYAARDADIIIINQNNTVIGTGRTDVKGNFSVTVPEGSGYQLIFRFNGQEIEKALSYPDAKNYIVDLGYFSTEKVGDWIDARLGLR
jgi:hypothetical protein